MLREVCLPARGIDRSIGGECGLLHDIDLVVSAFVLTGKTSGARLRGRVAFRHVHRRLCCDE
jgi:hypothetical protein